MKSINLIGIALTEALKSGRVFVKMEVQPTDSVFHVSQVLDPWHKEAFIGTVAEGYGTDGERKMKWYGEDWCGNLIIQLPDCEWGNVGDQLFLHKYKESTHPPVYIMSIDAHYVNSTIDSGCWCWEIKFAPKPVETKTTTNQ